MTKAKQRRIEIARRKLLNLMPQAVLESMAEYQFDSALNARNSNNLRKKLIDKCVSDTYFDIGDIKAELNEIIATATQKVTSNV